MRKHSRLSMTRGMLDKSIEFIERHAHPEEHLYVSFYGGEALLQLDEIRYAVERLTGKFGERVSFDISTNGLLLNEKNIGILLGYPNVDISVSIDGCREIHDANRKDACGKGTFDRIIRNMESFKDRNGKEYRKRTRILVTLASYSDAEKIDRDFERLRRLTGEKPILVSKIYPDFSHGASDEPYADKMRFLSKAMEYRRDGITNIHTCILDDFIKKHAIKNMCNTDAAPQAVKLHSCLDCMYCTFINAEGKLYPCEKFGTAHSIGNIGTGFDYGAMRRLVSAYAVRRTAICKSCNAFRYCHRCLADSKLSYMQQTEICKEIKENIRLGKLLNII